MAEDVNYKIHLDGIQQVEDGLKGIKEHADILHEGMSELKKMFVEVFAIEKIIEFGKESFKAFTDANVASAQLEATLTSTNNAVGLSKGELDELSESLSKNSLYTTTAVTSMQSVLTTFTSIHEDVFPQAQQAIADLASKMGEDLQSAAVQVGKALQDPVSGITALRRVGVNFNDTQKEVIANLVATGHAAEAQAMILNELSTEFGGSAEAAMKADTWGNFKKNMEETQVAVGGLINDGLKVIIPYLIDLAEALKASVAWIKEHKELVKGLAVGLGILITGFIAYKTAVIAIELPMKIVTAAQLAWNIALNANRIGLIIAGVAVLGTALYACYQHFEGFRRIVNTTWIALKDFGHAISDSLTLPLTTAYHAAAALVGILTGDFTGAKGHMKAIGDNFLNVVGDVKKGITDVKSAWGADYGEAKSPAEKLKEQGNVGKESSDATNPAKDSRSVTGTKQVTINVNINKLVELLKIEAHTVREGATEMTGHVSRALITALNQFSASADI